MKLKPLRLIDSLNIAYQKQSLSRITIDLFKTELSKLFRYVDDNQDEDYHKNLISNFLQTVYYKDKFIINVNKKQDLVIKQGNSVKDKVGIILEFKKPSETRDMLTIEHPNSKAFRQLILYYLRERIDSNNQSIKYLIATNFYEWYIFDEIWFEKYIYRNTQLINDYEEYKLSGHDTKFFYDEVAAKYIEIIDIELPCTYFNLKDYIQNPQGFENLAGLTTDDFKLINLYKIFSPEHLLKLPFTNDSNSLNKEFYNELLYILGLEEVKCGAKHTIERKIKNRNEGSLLENTIQILISRNKLKNLESYQNIENQEYFVYEIALELVITWLNRILFLKLLEGQLVKYHKGNIEYSFLNNQKINDFNELDELFFDILAKPIKERYHAVNQKFTNLPYLNSSLFEITDLENNTIRIADLKARYEIPVYTNTVLKDINEKQKIGSLNTLNYLFQFLNSFNFSSDDTAQIQEENKSIISASVLGLIFEKLNGYKDGSFFTPGFITMYICRETLRRAVVQKFKEISMTHYKNMSDLSDFEELKDKINYANKPEREKANEIINSIKICDPAVGSGHFLVSALNELIAIKSELKILNYTDGTRIRGIEITVENDELIVTEEETKSQFSYHVSDKHTPIKELQQLQEALFNEKRIIIENCLFGVDINPKSVMICRLRLWIELLKNAYYNAESNYLQLETLPNIDINIKVGNSLISRFDKRFNIFEKDILKKNILLYKIAVETYKNLKNYEGKDKLKNQINILKNNLIDIAVPIDPDFAKIKAKQRDLDNAMQLPNNYEFKGRLASELTQLNKEYEIKLNTLYKNCFEWFIEFPEVLSDEGEYLGFDVVVGNPPYMQVREFSEAIQKAYINSKYYQIAKGSRLNLFQFFIPLVYDILKPNGYNTLIYQNSFLAEETTQNVRTFVFDKQKIISIDSFPERDNENLRVFKEAKMSVCVTICQKKAEPDFIFTLRTWKDRKMKENKTINYSKKEIQSLFKEKLIIPMLSQNEFDLFLKINSINNKLNINIFSGELDMTASKPFFTKDCKYPLIVKGAQVQRYYISTKISQGEIEYLDTTKFFQENKKDGRFANFENERIVMQRITGVDSHIRLIMTLLPANCFCTNSTNYILDNYNNLRYLLGVLNSKLINYFFKLTSTNTNVTTNEIQRIPVPNFEQLIQKKIIDLVEEILSIKKQNSESDVLRIENQIDELVYEIYNLTPEEIEILQ